jgi:NADPH:quinone reductase-like Zn-dependent oxidoreductase
MKAVYFHEHGGPEVLTYGTLDTPQPGPGQVQVKVEAAALNHLDIFVRRGWPGIRQAYPHIPGADGAGVVSALGEGVDGVAVGERVVINPTLAEDPSDEYVLAGFDNMARRMDILGEHRRGTLAEYVVVPWQNVLPLPEHVPFEEAAATPVVFLTAWHSLITRGAVRPGETVLVVGAGGGVNTAAIQIAKLAGATVYVVGSTDDKLAKAQALGADYLVNHHEEDWGRAIYRMTGKRGVDVVVDNVGKATWPTSLRALARGGRMLVVGGTRGYDAQVGVNYIFARHLSIIGSTLGTRSDFRQVMGLIFAGRLAPVVDRVLPLNEIRAAHDLLESGNVFGKLVLRP